MQVELQKEHPEDFVVPLHVPEQVLLQEPVQVELHEEHPEDFVVPLHVPEQVLLQEPVQVELQDESHELEHELQPTSRKSSSFL